MHGTADEDVPVEIADAYVAAAQERGDNVTYLRREGVGHMELIDPGSGTWHEVVRWLEG